MADQGKKVSIKKKKSKDKHSLKEKEADVSKVKSPVEEKVNSDTITGKNTKLKHQLDPKDASDYLNLWKHQRDTQWKFKKNIQSWLLRHMYDWEKVPKQAFSILLEYLSSIQGNVTRERIMKDAMDVVQRYKQWEKETDNKESEEKDKEATQKDDSDAQNKETKDHIENFNTLSDHDKRKQYKRARQVLQALQE